MQSTNRSIASYRGRIQDMTDVAFLIQAVLNGKINKIGERLSGAQRRQLSSGDIYIYNKEESKIVRWTDGRLWSPSRISGPFLVYKEAEDKKKFSFEPEEPQSQLKLTKSERSLPEGVFTSQKGTFYFKRDGLIKKTVAINVFDKVYNIISYCRIDDIDNGQLLRPSQDPYLSTQILCGPLQDLLIQSKQSNTRSVNDQDLDSANGSEGSDETSHLPLKKRKSSEQSYSHHHNSYIHNHPIQSKAMDGFNNNNNRNHSFDGGVTLPPLKEVLRNLTPMQINRVY